MDEEVEMGEMLDGADNSCATAGGGDVASARERRTPAIASVTWTSVALLRRDPEIVRPLLLFLCRREHACMARRRSSQRTVPGSCASLAVSGGTLMLSDETIIGPTSLSHTTNL
jgi:hypothetical protein